MIDVTYAAGTTTPLRRYTHSDNVDEPLQLETFDAAGAFDARYSYHADHLGSIRFLTDALGEVVNAYDYDSYGQEVAAIEGVEQPFRFTGREWDEAAKLYHYRARAYDPSTGVFIQEDPIWFEAGDMNVQRYVGNNPLMFTDPSGQSSIGHHAVVAGSLAAGGGIAALGLAVECKYVAMAALFEGLLELDHSRPVDQVEIDWAGCGARVAQGAGLAVGTYYGIRYIKPLYRTCKPVLYIGAQLILNVDTSNNINQNPPERVRRIEFPKPNRPTLEGKSPGKC